MKRFFMVTLVLLTFCFVSCIVLAQEFPSGQQHGNNIPPPDKIGGPPGNCGEDNMFGPPQGPPNRGECGEQGRPPQGPPPELTEEDIAKFMSFAQKYLPTCYSILKEQKDTDSMEYKMLIADKFHMFMMLKGMMEKDKEMFDIIVKKIELEDQTKVLARKYKESGNEQEKTKIEGDLGKLLNELFDIRQKEDTMKATKMEEEVKRIRETITKREQNKATIVQDGINKLTEKDKYLEW